jgi:lysophospholipase L1-like esterase
MAEKVDAKKRLPLKKRLLYLAVLYLILFAFVEAGLEVGRAYLRSRISISGAAKDEEAIVILCIGDSMTFGLGADGSESYPAKIEGEFRKRYANVPVKIYNIGAPGTNTSEGLEIVRGFFAKQKTARPDYALILHGANNRWNLHNATIWNWEETYQERNRIAYWYNQTQLSKVFSVTQENAAGMSAALRNRSNVEYRQILDRLGWSAYFENYEDEFLSRWIREDLTAIIAEVRRHSVEPIVITYHFDHFGGLNPTIKQAAQEAGARLIDQERPMKFYTSQLMLSEDMFHFNAKGYAFFASSIMNAFQDLVSIDEIRNRLEWKKAAK